MGSGLGRPGVMRIRLVLDSQPGLPALRVYTQPVTTCVFGHRVASFHGRSLMPKDDGKVLRKPCWVSCAADGGKVTPPQEERQVRYPKGAFSLENAVLHVRL